MKKLITIIILILSLNVFAQGPLIITRPYSFTTYLTAKYGLVGLNTWLLPTDTIAGRAWVTAHFTTGGSAYYAAGTGITLTSQTFSHTAHTGDATGITSLTVVSLRGRSLSTTIPTSGNVLSYDGTSWTPSVATGTTYAAGTGLTLSSNTFSANTTVANWNANKLQGFSISSATPNPAQIMKYTSSTWTPTDEVSYVAGTGLTLSSGTFSQIAHSGDVSGTNTLTIVSLAGTGLDATIPSLGQVLGFDGSKWIPRNTYIAKVSSTTTLTPIALTTEYFLMVTNGSTAIILNLPTAIGIKGTMYIIKKCDAEGSGTITIYPVGGQYIDQQANIQLAGSSRGIYRLISDGVNWFTW
jgi:hypothetical protein